MARKPCKCARYNFPHRKSPACYALEQPTQDPGPQFWEDQRDRAADLKRELRSER
jgi:hypothetical protein